MIGIITVKNYLENRPDDRITIVTKDYQAHGHLDVVRVL